MKSPTDVFALTRQLVDIQSVTGNEGRVGRFLLDLLRRDGWECLSQEVSPGRFNVLARCGRPSVLLTTHIDTVPPFFPSSENGDWISGRGSCDAKGIAAAMICAASALREEGVSDLGLLFVVGEETDSDGARKALELDLHCSFIVDGEPTDNHLAEGHKGTLWLRLLATGTTAHSAYPERGESATAKLVDCLYDLSRHSFPEDPVLGRSLLNIGKLDGGVAPNVVADRAEAEVLIRTVRQNAQYLDSMAPVIGERCTVEVIRTSEAQRMHVVSGFPRKVVGFGTDIPVLRDLGQPLLAGPGSILEAHTVAEKIAKQELLEGVGLYQRLVRALRSDSKVP